MNIIEDWIKSFCIDYIDPDGIYINNKNEFKYKNKEYYLKYIEYLKNRSDKFDIKMEDNKPGLLMINKETKKEYYLKSDQFGFSAPSIYLNHPYDIYLKMNSNNNLCVAIEKVKMWLKESRMVGGSFFWPMEKDEEGKIILNPKYNIERGGTKFKRRGSYIEDRVDLTLFEIKEIYDSGILKNKKVKEISKINVLNKRCLSKLMKEWLLEFGSFGEYIDFFALDHFVCKESKIPINICSEFKNILLEKDRKRNLFDLKNPKEYETIFDNIVNMIKKRNEQLKKGIHNP